MSEDPEEQMEDQADEPTETLSDSIRRALEAAAAANDAAEESSAVVNQSRAAIAAAVASQRKLTAIAGGALAASTISIVLAGLVYLRSTADLREAAELQAAANKAGIEQMQSINSTIKAAEEALVTISDLNDKIEAQFVGLGDRISDDLASVIAESSALQPQIASSIKETVETSLQQSSDEMLTALAELQAVLGSGGTDPELKVLLADLRDKLTKPVAPPAAAPKQKANAPAQKAKPKAKPKPSEPSSNFSFP